MLLSFSMIALLFEFRQIWFHYVMSVCLKAATTIERFGMNNENTVTECINLPSAKVGSVALVIVFSGLWLHLFCYRATAHSSGYCRACCWQPGWMTCGAVKKPCG